MRCVRAAASTGTERLTRCRLIAHATGGHDLTLVDTFGDVDHAPRRLLAAALKQIATQRTKRHARARRSGGLDEPRPYANRSDATPLPDAPP